MAIKNALAMDIRGYLEKAEYLGWRPTIEGKHVERKSRDGSLIR